MTDWPTPKDVQKNFGAAYELHMKGGTSSCGKTD